VDNPPAPRIRVPGLNAIFYLLLGALVLASLTYWLPWIGHRSAALRLSGQDLGEFVKFVPALQDSPTGALRHLLYLPPLASAASLALLAASRCVPYPRHVRVCMLALALLVLIGLLPPVWGGPRDLFIPQYRVQSVAALLGASIVLAHGLYARVRLVSLAWVTAALSVVALVPSQCVFWIAWPPIRAAYGTPSVYPGWGLALHIVSWLGTLILAVVLLCLVRGQAGHIPSVQETPANA
jgi:hypothetical protein